MIIPEVKRLMRLEQFNGKTIKEIQEKGFGLRFIFSDGTFADLQSEVSADSKIVLERGPGSRIHRRREGRS